MDEKDTLNRDSNCTGSSLGNSTQNALVLDRVFHFGSRQIDAVEKLVGEYENSQPFLQVRSIVLLEQGRVLESKNSFQLNKQLAPSDF